MLGYRSLFGLFATFFCISSLCTAQTLYDVQDLESDWWPSAVSNNGIVVGSANSYPSYAVQWIDGHLYQLPIPETMWGDPVVLNAGISAIDIDDNGESIVGWIHVEEYNPAFVTLWEEGSVQILSQGIGDAINTQHQIAVNDDDGFYGYILDNGTRISIFDYEDGYLYPSVFQVSAINNVGQAIVNVPMGSSAVADGVYLWEDGELYSIEELVTHDITFDEAWASDINDLTQFVGDVEMQDAYGDWSAFGFLFDAGSIVFMGQFRPKAINEAAQVVGENYLYDYEAECLMDLNGLVDPDAGWQIHSTTDINDEGVIIGRGRLNGNRRNFMLVPCEATTNFYDNDNDGFGDPRETALACSPLDDYVEAVGTEELIVNGGMEGDSNWYDWEDPTANERTDTQVYRGNYARLLSADSAYDGIHSEAFNLRAGRTYRATLRVYGNGSIPLRALVAMDNLNLFQYKPNDQFPVPPADWTRYSWTFRPTRTGDYTFYVELAPRGGTGDFYIDDVSLTRVVEGISDCNDTNDAINPDAREICNGIDDNCDGTIDEGVTTTFYRDGDGDGYGNPSNTRQACTAPQGYSHIAGDCDDTDENVHPEAEEVCNNADDDCDGNIDEGVTTTFYRDSDADGYGDAGNTTQACTPPSGYAADASDCDDTRDSIHPTAPETCNGLDDDCDGTTDERVKTTYYRDADGDGYGDILNTTEACSVPSGYLLTAGDCDDTRAHMYPGAVEGCNNLDDDCDGTIDEDCIENEIPVADAGRDQAVSEGSTVTLDGSNSSDIDDAIDTWKWVQIDGPSVVLSDTASTNTTFIAPPVTTDGAQLTFRLIVTDLKGALDTAEVSISVVDNGIQGFPEDVITLLTDNQTAIGFKILEGGSLVAIRESVGASLTTNRALPDELTYEPFGLQIRTSNNGDDIKLACYLSDPLPDTHTVYMHSNSDEWIDLKDQAVFNAERTIFETTLVNGGELDEDDKDDGFVSSTLSLGLDSDRQSPKDPVTDSSSGSGGGGFCFIGSLH